MGFAEEHRVELLEEPCPWFGRGEEDGLWLWGWWWTHEAHPCGWALHGHYHVNLAVVHPRSSESPEPVPAHRLGVVWVARVWEQAKAVGCTAHRCDYQRPPYADDCDRG